MSNWVSMGADGGWSSRMVCLPSIAWIPIYLMVCYGCSNSNKNHKLSGFNNKPLVSYRSGDWKPEIKGWFLLRAVRKNLFCLFPSFWWFAGTVFGVPELDELPRSLPFCSQGVFPVCVGIQISPFLKGYRSYWIGAQSIPVWPHLNEFHLQCPDFQVLEVKTST